MWMLSLAACGAEPADPAPRPAAPHKPAVAKTEPAPTAVAQERVTLTFGGFSAAREALGTRILPRFARKQLLTDGKQVQFTERYEGSSALAESIATSFPADIAVFASTDDLDRLVQLGRVRPTWHNAPNAGIVSRSLVVLAVRKGNPAQIRGWSDLARPGVRIVTPNPNTSGGGRWNVCAIYGAALRGHADVPAGDPAAALQFVKRVFANVVEQRGNAAESFQSFQDGLGDGAITYESEVGLGWLFGHDEERVIPTSTLLIENPAAVIDRNADQHGVRAEAEALLQFLWTRDAQHRLADCGLRPVDPAVAAELATRFPTPPDLWTIEFLGGWQRAVREVLVPASGAADDEATPPPAAPPRRPN
jgi:sulfate/thiosulfate transport system substrate-binding protein